MKKKAEALLRKYLFMDDNDNLSIENKVTISLMVEFAKTQLNKSIPINDSDIATIEYLEDLLIENHGYKTDHQSIIRSRKLTQKMYDALYPIIR